MLVAHGVQVLHIPNHICFQRARFEEFDAAGYWNHGRPAARMERSGIEVVAFVDRRVSRFHYAQSSPLVSFAARTGACHVPYAADLLNPCCRHRKASCSKPLMRRQDLDWHEARLIANGADRAIASAGGVIRSNGRLRRGRPGLRFADFAKRSFIRSPRLYGRTITRIPTKIDTGDQFVDAASQSLAQRQIALESKSIASSTFLLAASDRCRASVVSSQFRRRPARRQCGVGQGHGCSRAEPAKSRGSVAAISIMPNLRRPVGRSAVERPTEGFGAKHVTYRIFFLKYILTPWRNISCSPQCKE
jgi:hypothetical protein